MTKRISDEEMGTLLRLLRSAEKSGFDRRGYKGRRDHALVHLLVATGCRIAEAVALRLCDVEPITVKGRPAFRIMFAGKGRRRRVNVITNGVVDVLQSYLDRRPGLRRAGAPLFWSLGSRGALQEAPMTPDAGYQVVRALGARVGMKLNPHRFRHSLASRMADAGRTPFQLMTWFGWSQVQTAARYVNVSDGVMADMASLVWSADA